MIKYFLVAALLSLSTFAFANKGEIETGIDPFYANETNFIVTGDAASIFFKILQTDQSGTVVTEHDGEDVFLGGKQVGCMKINGPEMIAYVCESRIGNKGELGDIAGLNDPRKSDLGQRAIAAAKQRSARIGGPATSQPAVK